MGEEADYLIEQMELAAISNGMWGDEDLHSFPYAHSRRTISHRELVELAKQAAHDGNIVERAMRNMTLDQVIRRKNDNT